MSPAKALTRAQVILINDLAIRNDLNRALDESVYDLLDPEGYSIMSVAMLHEHAGGMLTKPHYRCQILMKFKDSPLPETGFIDVFPEDYDRLPDAETMLMALKADVSLN